MPDPARRPAQRKLAVVYGIVQTHNGWITVDSQPGRGSRFEIFLPAVEQTVADETPMPPVRLAELQGDGARILLVEDEPAGCCRKTGAKPLEVSICSGNKPIQPSENA